jgi:hypothetical protein
MLNNFSNFQFVSTLFPDQAFETATHYNNRGSTPGNMVNEESTPEGVALITSKPFLHTVNLTNTLTQFCATPSGVEW